MTDYQAVQKALSTGTEPAMLCATCPWDRHCFTPPTMTSADIDARIEEGARMDEQQAGKRTAEQRGGMPVATLMSALIFAGKDTAAQVCPVFALRLRSSGGRRIADQFKGLMQEWDDQK